MFFLRLVICILCNFSFVLNAVKQEQSEPCTFTLHCTDDPLCQIYPNQNQCVLFDQIPKELRSLPYVVTPLNPKYDSLRFNYNKRFNIFPHAIILPENAEQTAHAFKILKKHNLKFAIRSGGHCYGPGSLSSGYIIDVRNFNYVIPNTKCCEVRIGAGTHLGGVIQELGNIGWAIPSGTCPSVGVTGNALGGGIGFLTRKFGLTCDAVKKILMINAEGQLIEVDKVDHCDLFWAMRGAGGGSFGIVLEFTFKMFFVPKVQLLQLRWEWDADLVQHIVNAWQKWIVNLSDDISTEVDFDYVDGKLKIGIDAMKVGTEPFDEWKKPFKNLNPSVFLKELPYIDAARIEAGACTLPFSKVKSKMLFKPLSDEGIHIIINFLEQLQEKNKNFLIHLDLGAAGGKFAEGRTSFFPRKAFAYLFQFACWNNESQDREAIRELTEFYEKLAPFTSPYSYANLVDFELGPTYLNAYYGDHVDRLICIKRKVDPENLFHWRQSIPLEKPKV